MNQNTITCSFDLRPKTWGVLLELVQGKLTALSSSDVTTAELWNVLNEIRATLQHHVADAVKPVETDWL